eukprot:gene21316-1192_t
MLTDNTAKIAFALNDSEILTRLVLPSAITFLVLMAVISIGFVLATIVRRFRNRASEVDGDELSDTEMFYKETKNDKESSSWGANYSNFTMCTDLSSEQSMSIAARQRQGSKEARQSRHQSSPPQHTFLIAED